MTGDSARLPGKNKHYKARCFGLINLTLLTGFVREKKDGEGQKTELKYINKTVLF